MNMLIPLLLGSVLGVDVGWTAAPDNTGGRVYIIQLKPDLVDRLKEGETINSIIDPRAGAITQVRIQVGDGPLPRTRIAAAPSDVEKDEPPRVFVLPPLPDDGVLDISGSPQPAGISGEQGGADASLDRPLGNTLPAEDGRESAFSFPIVPSDPPLAGPGSETDEETGFSVELSSDEIQNTVEFAVDTGADDPGEFIPSLPVGEAIPFTDDLPAEDTAVVMGENEVSAATYGEIIEALKPSETAEPVEGHSTRPWMPLTLTLMALLASLGGNAYLGYLFIGLYRRHRVLSNTAAGEETPEDEGDVDAAD
jgi:hypothetical protein